MYSVGYREKKCFVFHYVRVFGRRDFKKIKIFVTLQRDRKHFSRNFILNARYRDRVYNALLSDNF